MKRATAALLAASLGVYISAFNPPAVNSISRSSICMKLKFRVAAARIASSRRLMSREDRLDNESQLQTKTDHPDAICWHSTLEQSPNSYVHPSIELVIRPPTEGGTGVVARGNIPENTTIISLAVDEVAVIDAATIIEAYKRNSTQQHDQVMDMLVKLWHGIEPLTLSEREDGEIDVLKERRQSKSDVLAALVAHLQLVRYKDLDDSIEVKAGFALDESRRLGHFLDSMPLLPRKSDSHPFPSNFLFWKEKESRILLNQTLARNLQTLEQEYVGDSIHEWYTTFLAEHPELALSHVVDAIESSSATLNSRAFARGYPREVNGFLDRDQAKDEHILVPLVDKMNHDENDQNVIWESPLLDEVEEGMVRKEGKRVVFNVTTIRDINVGDEILTSYGKKPCWIFALSYGFLPPITRERYAYSGIPLFPDLLDLAPDSDAKLDLRQPENHAPLIKAIRAAIEAIDKHKPQRERTKSRFQFFALPTSTRRERGRFRPLIEVETRIGIESNANITKYHKASVQTLLPIFRAAASVISQLQYNHQNQIKSPIKLKKIVLAAGLKDTETDWNKEALNLMHSGINDRLTSLQDAEKEASEWIESISMHYIEERDIRYQFANDIRDSEVKVLESLNAAIKDWHG